MIFVTVGTHEQPFNRLVRCMDELKQKGTVEDDVVIQTGFSTYEPMYCKWNKLFSYQDMLKNVEKARIIITHGGPSSFIMALQLGKIPIVVPRKKKFHEHVNDHQVEFCRTIVSRVGIIVVEDTEKLGSTILNYDNIVSDMPDKIKSNTQEFNHKFAKIADSMFHDGMGNHNEKGTDCQHS